ncbi:MAG: T9SS type A sorting domain-containing protein [Flammeovirgaceae bacterium]|nr:T9SS type A sorting domain-containing protein [Flammeovirgaceae bacterium]
MKLLAPLPFLLLTTTSLSAQITVTIAIFPVAGDTLKMDYATNPEIAVSVYTPPGGGQTWDLSGLQPGVTEDIIFKPADQGGVGAQLPGAELFAALSPTKESYYNVTPTKFELQAYYGIAPYGIVANHKFDYRPPYTERDAPLNFFDIHAISSGIIEQFVPSEFSPALMLNLALQNGNPQIDSMLYRVAQYKVGAVDAYGSMTIPGGTYDVLREKTHTVPETRIDAQIPPLGWMDITDNAIPAGFYGLGFDTITEFYFYNDIAKEPIAMVTFNTKQNTATQVVFKNNVIVSGTTFVDSVNPSITISPNPASDEAKVSFINVVAGPYRPVIFDAPGQMIHQNTLQLSDNHTEKVNLSRLLPGMYVITLYDHRNRLKCQEKLMKGGR